MSTQTYTSLAFALLLATGAASAPASPAPEPTQQPPKVQRLDIVDRAIEQHGGDLYTHSTTSMEICSRSGCFDLRVRMDGGLYEYVVEQKGEGGEVVRKVRVSNDEVERWEGGKPVKLRGEDVQRSRDFANARVYFPYLPFRLNDASTYKQDLGLERWGGKELHKVKVSFQAGTSTDADDEYLFWFDPETARLEQFAYSFGRGENAGVRFRRLFNYRRVGGILFADQTNLGASAPDIRVDVTTPEFVESGMEEVSTVVLKDIQVEPLQP